MPSYLLRSAYHDVTELWRITPQLVLSSSNLLDCRVKKRREELESMLMGEKEREKEKMNDNDNDNDSDSEISKERGHKHGETDTQREHSSNRNKSTRKRKANSSAGRTFENSVKDVVQDAFANLSR